MHHSNGYFRIDTIFYQVPDTINFPNPKFTRAEYISIAFEHENEYQEVAEETNRLKIYNVPLSGLITYQRTTRSFNPSGTANPIDGQTIDTKKLRIACHQRATVLLRQSRRECVRI